MNNSLNRFELERKHPVRTFEVWLTPDGQLRGYEIFEFGFPDSTKGYDMSHNCFGQSASICIVSNDKHIDRGNAIKFATYLVLGKMKAFSISLEGL